MSKTISKGDTKAIKCKNCSNTIITPKWATNKQLCKDCVKNESKEVEEIVGTNVDVVEETPADKVRKSQQVLENLGFVITSRGYHKIYHDGTAAVKIEPFFDNGNSMDTTYALAGFTVTRQEIIAVTDTGLANKLPPVSHQDIQSLTRELQVKIPGVELKKTHIDNIVCSKCEKETSEWMQLGSQLLCLSKCAPVRRPFTR